MNLKVYSIDGLTPIVHPSATVHPTATLIGDVVIGANCRIGACVSLRGDLGRVIVGDGVNLQETCVIHGAPDSDTSIGDRAHIGHGAALYGCRVGANALVGINAVVLHGAEIGECAVIMAMALVSAAFMVPPRHLVAGVPAALIRELSFEEVARKLYSSSLHQERTVRVQRNMRATTPLASAEAERRRVPARRVWQLKEEEAKPAKI